MASIGFWPASAVDDARTPTIEVGAAEVRADFRQGECGACLRLWHGEDGRRAVDTSVFDFRSHVLTSFLTKADPPVELNHTPDIRLAAEQVSWVRNRRRAERWADLKDALFWPRPNMDASKHWNLVGLLKGHGHFAHVVHRLMHPHASPAFCLVTFPTVLVKFQPLKINLGRSDESVGNAI